MENNNERIFKNTVFLYFRMILTMGLGLLSSRYILQSLGVVDFGIYNVVGSIVTMFTFLNGSMAASVSRYLTFEIGKNDNQRLQDVFSTSILAHWVLAIIIVILSETIGLWFLYNKMVIPIERFNCAFWVFQISILSTAINIISVPYNSLIIAHEKMSTFAFITVMDSVLKFSAAFFLVYYTGDKLFLYAILIMIILTCDRIIYRIYCKRKFPETKLRFFFEKKLFISMFSFAGWTLNGNLAIMGTTTGVNMLLNTFFGPIVNTARGIAMQVNGAIISFYSNFQMAINPQITKLYAQNEFHKMHELISLGTRISFYLLIIIGAPIFANTSFIIHLWLGTVPAYSVNFFRVILITNMIGCMARPLITSIHATGNIKKFQLWESSILLFTLPFSYIMLKLGMPPITVFLVQLCIEFVTQVVRIKIVLPRISYPLKKYLKTTIYPIFYISIIASFIIISTNYLWPNENWINFIISSSIIVLLLITTILLIGFSKEELTNITQFIHKKKI